VGNGLLVVHRHAREGFLDVARHALGIVGVAARPFRIDVDQAHLDRGEGPFQLVHAVLGGDAGLHALIHPLVFRAPVDVALGLEHVGAPAAEAEGRPAHALDGDVAGENEEVSPA
jgi:hypothetical protein